MGSMKSQSREWDKNGQTFKPLEDNEKHTVEWRQNGTTDSASQVLSVSGTPAPKFTCGMALSVMLETTEDVSDAHLSSGLCVPPLLCRSSAAAVNPQAETTDDSSEELGMADH